MADLNNLKMTLNTAIVFLKEDLNKFSEGFAKDPAYALSWSETTFEMAAKLEVYSKILAWVNEAENGLGSEEAVLEFIKAKVTDEALTAARQVSSSTSKAANLMADYRRVAWAQAISGFNAVLK